MVLKMNFKKGISLYNKAKKIIPGGTQLLSKRSEMYLPENWPSYFKKANGVEIWDLDGNKFVDMCNMSVGACTLGYADENVNKSLSVVSIKEVVPLKELSISTSNSVSFPLIYAVAVPCPSPYLFW